MAVNVITGCRARPVRRHVTIKRAVAMLCAGQRIDPSLYERAAWCGLR